MVIKSDDRKRESYRDASSVRKLSAEDRLVEGNELWKRLIRRRGFRQRIEKSTRNYCVPPMAERKSMRGVDLIPLHPSQTPLVHEENGNSPKSIWSRYIYLSANLWSVSSSLLSFSFSFFISEIRLSDELHIHVRKGSDNGLASNTLITLTRCPF